MDSDTEYEARHGWNSGTTRVVIIGAIFVALAAAPMWSGRVRLDGILMPAGFLPVLRIVDVVLFGGFLVIAIGRAMSRKLTLRADVYGIAFGSGAAVPWSEIHAVELFVRRVQAGRRTTSIPYVAVYRPAAAPPVQGASRQAGRRTLSTPDGDVVAASRQLSGVDFDRQRFEAVVRHYAPRIPINVRPEFATT